MVIAGLMPGYCGGKSHCLAYREPGNELPGYFRVSLRDKRSLLLQDFPNEAMKRIIPSRYPV